MKKYQHYINGEWIDSTGNEIIAVVNPATEEVIGEISAPFLGIYTTKEIIEGISD